MMRAAAAVVVLGLLFASPASATHNEPLRGQWQFEDPQCVNAPCYSADSSGHSLNALDTGSPPTWTGARST